MNPRPYQIEAIDASKQALTDFDSALLVMATGLGKTVVFSYVIDHWHTRNESALVIVHRDELARQAAEKIEDITGRFVGIEMGQSYAPIPQWDKPSTVVASVQTLCRQRRRDRFGRDSFGLIITDEAHHAAAPSYRTVYDYFRGKHLGVTATPKRADEKALGRIFQTVAFQFDIRAGIDEGYLVPIQQNRVVVEGLDFTNLKTSCGDFQNGELEMILSQEKPLHEMAAATVKLAGQRPTLVFTCGVQHAKLMAQVLGRYGVSAVSLDGETDQEVRRREVERYKAGQTQFLCNCGLFLEGFDAPTTSVVVMGRPTKSLTLYTQVLGRGTRPLPGIVETIDDATGRRAAIAMSGKPRMSVLDFAGNAGRHKLVSAVDLLGGKFSDDIREQVKREAKADAGVRDIDSELARVEEEMIAFTDLSNHRQKIRARSVEYRTEEISPFGAGRCRSNPNQPQLGTVTDKQRRLIYVLTKKLRRNYSEPTVMSWSKRQASAVIGKLKAELGE